MYSTNKIMTVSIEYDILCDKFIRMHESEVESSRTFSASRTHFEFLGLGLEGQVLDLDACKSSKMSCPRLKDSSFSDLLKMGHGHDLLFILPWKTAETSRKMGRPFFYFYFWRTPDFSRKFRVFSREDLFF